MNNNFAQINAKQLFHPRVLDNTNPRPWGDYSGFKIKHAQPLYLARETWAVVYGGERDYENANNLVKMLG